MSSIATKIHNRIKSKLRAQILRVRRFLSLYQWPRIPEPPLWQFPAGMTILAVGGAGVRVIDNFVSREEARQLIDLYRQQLKRSTVIGPDYKSIKHGYRTSSDALIQLVDADPLVHRIIYRAATMVGLPFPHAERFSLTRYQNGEYYKIHSDHDGSINADRLYTVLNLPERSCRKRRRRNHVQQAKPGRPAYLRARCRLAKFVCRQKSATGITAFGTSSIGGRCRKMGRATLVQTLQY
jgi:hypothetical protein